MTKNMFFTKINVFWQGGVATDNEMCTTNIYFYPRNNLTVYLSNTPELQIVQVVGEIELV